MDPAALEKLKTARWLARTDLLWLCNNVLGYDLVNEQIHGGLISKLQKFPRPTSQQFEENDKPAGKSWIYTPIKPLDDLVCSKRTMVLDSRGFAKTTINTIAHTIQWILNYPDITIIIVQSNLEKAILFLKEIKAHFTSNEKFRKLFPEHVPQKKTFDWGTQTQFTTEARSKTSTRREPTVMTASIDKGVAGIHVHVMKFSDIVEENNSKDAQMAEAVYYNFNSMLNLLDSPIYWVDLEGTRYNYSDCYGQIIDKEMKRPPHERKWDFYINSCFERVAHGPRTYGPEELDLPFAKDAAGNYISRWPKRFPLEDLLEQQRNDPRIFSCQQLNAPVMGGGKKPFPPDEIKWVDKEHFRDHVNVAYREIVVDTAYTDKKRSDFTAITVGAWDNDGRLYVEQIYHGKWLPDEFIKVLVGAVRTHRPARIKIEQTAYTMGIQASLGREMVKSGIRLPIEYLKRDNQRTKEERILNTLQPWFKNGWIRFLKDIHPRHELEREMDRFPDGGHDDILDTLADFFQNKTYFGRNNDRPDEETAEARKAAFFAAARARYMSDIIGAPIGVLTNENFRTPDPVNHNIRPGLTGIL